jgi:ribosomal protein L7Ae-like RNA K-turn-binding protein
VDKLFVTKKMPHVVIICSTQNDKVTNKVIRFCDENKIKVIKLSDLILAELIGRDNCKVVGLLDYNLASAVMNEFQMGNEK